MKSGKCPKCGSENIYQSVRPKVYNTFGNFIYIKIGFLKNRGANLIHYACDDCQYLESYVADDESMNTIREAWTPMNPRKSKRKNDEV